MPEIFLSYKREDLAIAAVIAADIRAEGFSVFFDQDIAVGERWDAVIDEAIEQAKAVVVLWSPNSRGSEWVRNEARFGKTAGNLCPAIIETCNVPIEFNSVQAADLRARKAGDRADSEWRRLIAAIERHTGKAPPPNIQPEQSDNPNVAYWAAFGDVARRHGVEREALRAARSSNYLRKLERLAPREFYTASYISRAQGGSIGAYLWLWSQNPEDAAELEKTVRSLREQIRDVVAEPVQIRRQTKNGVWVYLLHQANPDDRADWPAQHEWLAERMALLAKSFETVVRPHLPPPASAG